MQKRGGQVLYSAADIVDVFECEHLTSRDLINLDTALLSTVDNDEVKLKETKGHAHEDRFVVRLKTQHRTLKSTRWAEDCRQCI
ncbi:hypothetical protein [Aromatoleum anaerobium]|uniref:Transposase n=1 Tax=Aromatoleum anaerobium TaxID=182180 RepID=A0ABX1PQK4_9RHOO|nr:hypothetical protein [Aromatoleum anaerobium]MCK0508563.1 hypothetical protein [Aromatoleum anaerobium]